MPRCRAHQLLLEPLYSARVRLLQLLTLCCQLGSHLLLKLVLSNLRGGDGRAAYSYRDRWCLFLEYACADAAFSFFGRGSPCLVPDALVPLPLELKNPSQQRLLCVAMHVRLLLALVRLRVALFAINHRLLRHSFTARSFLGLGRLHSHSALQLYHNVASLFVAFSLGAFQEADYALRDISVDLTHTSTPA